MKKKTVKLVSAVVVLGVLCAAYEGVNFYVTSQEEKAVSYTHLTLPTKLEV